MVTFCKITIAISLYAKDDCFDAFNNYDYS